MPPALPRFDRPSVDLAGDALIGDAAAVLALENRQLDALEIISDWKLVHQYPGLIFRNTLQNRTRRIDPTGVVVQRNKRLSSIQDKLGRIDWLKLSEMQDIAGCRAIVASVQQVYELAESYKSKHGDHELADYKDYIRNPKRDGYRSYHLIYRYSNPKLPLLKGLKVELQLRSVLQHCWATAIETADIFYRESLKSGHGSPKWRRFFALMGAAIAFRERTRRIPRTPKEETELVSELRGYAADLDVVSQLTAFGQTLNVTGEREARRVGIKYVLLVLNPGAGTEGLKLYGFGASDIEEASRRATIEERYKADGADVVLVSMTDAANLRRAFPNYFLDTKLFLQTLQEFIS